jgi:hypothetical protein
MGKELFLEIFQHQLTLVIDIFLNKYQLFQHMYYQEKKEFVTMHHKNWFQLQFQEKKEYVTMHHKNWFQFQFHNNKFSPLHLSMKIFLDHSNLHKVQWIWENSQISSTNSRILKFKKMKNSSKFSIILAALTELEFQIPWMILLLTAMIWDNKMKIF